MEGYEEKARALVRDYALRARRAEEEAKLREAELCARIPALSKVREELSSYAPRLLLALSGDEKTADKRIAALKKENLALQQKQAQLLRENGLGEDAFAVQYRCKLCSDSGYRDGRMCECLKRALNRLRAEESGLSSLYHAQTFENFDLSRISDALDEKSGESAREIMRGIYEDCRQYAEGFCKDSRSMLFVGGTGLGKTHLSSAIARVVIDRGFYVLYESAMQVVSSLERERFADEQARTNTDKALHCDLLILDDLGTELAGAASASYLYYVINTRLVQNRPTIVSTNLSARELKARYEPRLVSRLFGEYEVMLFAGSDMRRAQIGTAE